MRRRRTSITTDLCRRLRQELDMVGRIVRVDRTRFGDRVWMFSDLAQRLDRAPMVEDRVMSWSAEPKSHTESNQECDDRADDHKNLPARLEDPARRTCRPMQECCSWSYRTNSAVRTSPNIANVHTAVVRPSRKVTESAQPIRLPRASCDRNSADATFVHHVPAIRVRHDARGCSPVCADIEYRHVAARGDRGDARPDESDREPPRRRSGLGCRLIDRPHRTRRNVGERVSSRNDRRSGASRCSIRPVDLSPPRPRSMPRRARSTVHADEVRPCLTLAVRHDGVFPAHADSRTRSWRVGPRRAARIRPGAPDASVRGSVPQGPTRSCCRAFRSIGGLQPPLMMSGDGRALRPGPPGRGRRDRRVVRCGREQYQIGADRECEQRVREVPMSVHPRRTRRIGRSCRHPDGLFRCRHRPAVDLPGISAVDQPASTGVRDVTDDGHRHRPKTDGQSRHKRRAGNKQRDLSKP